MFGLPPEYCGKALMPPGRPFGLNQPSKYLFICVRKRLSDGSHAVVDMIGA